MDVDTPAPAATRTFHTGTEQLSFRRDNFEIQYPLEDGLGRSINHLSLFNNELLL